MELIIINGPTSLRTTHVLIQQLTQIGYQYFDPDMYFQSKFKDTTLEFQDLLSAKRACLQEALVSVSQGMPVVINGDFVGASDLDSFRELPCQIEFVEAETSSPSLIAWLLNKRKKLQTPVSEHWLKFKLFQVLGSVH